MIPVVDVSALERSGPTADDAVAALDEACRHHGFFTVVGHGVDPGLIGSVDRLAREFFALPERDKEAIAMARAGQAWRGWFPVGGELTSGVPDRKEGIYFGAELGEDHPRVAAGVPLHGRNLFPDRPRELRAAVLGYLDALTALGHRLAAGLSRALGLPAAWFADHLTGDPTVLFRIFHYPPAGPGEWGVAEHTDYGLLTILHQDASGGLEVHGPAGWTDVPPAPGTFVCNLGDMLERLTGGAYRSTPHRVRPPADAHRVSLAFFFDPSWDATVSPLPRRPAPTPGRPRWDGREPSDFDGTYGQYLLDKVAAVFPELARGSRSSPA